MGGQSARSEYPAPESIALSMIELINITEPENQLDSENW